VIFIKPGRTTFHHLHRKVKHRIGKDFKEIKAGRSQIVLTDLYEQTYLSKLFTDDDTELAFEKGRKLTTYAYEVPGKQISKISQLQFVHIIKSEMQLVNRKYQTYPRYVGVQPSDTYKTIVFKIF